MAKGDELQLPSDLENAERFQRLFVTPVVETVKTEMKSMFNQLKADYELDHTEQKELRADIDSLKSNQKKALVGWGVFASALSVVIGFCGNWIKSKFTFKT